MPTASVGAPPVRDMIDVSPTSLATGLISSGVTTKPHDEMTCAACSAVVPISPARAVHCEIDAGMDDACADHRHYGDERFH